MLYKKAEQNQQQTIRSITKPRTKKKQKPRIFQNTDEVRVWMRTMFGFAKEMEEERKNFILGVSDPRKLYSYFSSIMYSFYMSRNALNGSKDKIDPETFTFLTYVLNRINGEYMAYQIKTALPNGSYYPTRPDFEDDLQEFLITVMKHVRYTLFVEKNECDAFCDGQDWARSAHYHAPADNEAGYIDKKYNHFKKKGK